MKLKFDKYQGSFNDINKVLAMTTVLDPRYEMQFLRHYFNMTYDDASITEKFCKQVEDFMCSLCGVYNELQGNTSQKQAS